MATMKTGRKLGDMLLSLDHSDCHLSVCYENDENELTEYNIPIKPQTEADLVLGYIVHEFISSDRTTLHELDSDYANAVKAYSDLYYLIDMSDKERESLIKKIEKLKKKSK